MPSYEETVISRVRNELENHERGVRTWSMVEIQNNTWFQVDSCTQSDALPVVTTYILSNLEAALALTKSLEGNAWTELRLCSRLPRLAANEVILETVEQILAAQDGTNIIFLSSGLIIYKSTRDEGVEESFIAAKVVYRSK